MSQLNTSVTVSDLLTANNIGGGAGLPYGPRQDGVQLTTWLGVNKSAGVKAYNDQAMWQQFTSGPQYVANGNVLTEGNWREVARQESARLRDLGFVQVDKPKFATLIFESYRRAAGSNSTSLFKTTEESNAVWGDTLRHYEWDYVASGAVETLTKGLGDVVKKGGDKLEDLGEVVTNPLTLPALAVIAAATAFILLR